MKTYIPLHVHSHFSLLDGLSKPEQIADRCHEIGAKSCALTDHGNIAGSVQFFTSMKKKNIKPILGCEIYVCRDDPKNKVKENSKLSHFLVLANTGAAITYKVQFKPYYFDNRTLRWNNSIAGGGGDRVRVISILTVTEIAG